MISSARLVETLGGAKVFRERPSTYRVVVDRVRAGLPYAALEAVATRFEIPQEAMVRVLHLPTRTLARRKKEQRLRPDESDRLLRLGRVAAIAEQVLGSRANASRWLRAPNMALGGPSPLDQLDTDLGAHQVEEILGRIEHGVYS
jgi:putative toxin-antitoxin system antitoxin component (TIGR02293 family)